MTNNTNERWIDPAVMSAFKAALPATEADGGISWPYSLYDAANKIWVAFGSLAAMEAATRPNGTTAGGG